MIAGRKTLLAVIAINAVVYVFYVKDFTARGLDFQAFYGAGETIRNAPSRVYDLSYQRVIQRSQFGDQSESQFRPFFHPPHELLVFAPFSLLPYALSLSLWRIFNLLCLAGSGFLFAGAVRMNRSGPMLYFLAMAPVAVCLFEGQDSMLLVLFISACFYFLRRDRDALAGLVLAVAMFKPVLPVVIAVALLASGRRKLFSWFVGSGATLVALSLSIVGRAGVAQMLQGLKLAEQSSLGMPTVRGLAYLVAGDHPRLAYMAFVLALAGMFFFWRRARSLDFAIASAICLGCAFAPYLRIYDLVALAIPLLLTVDKAKSNAAITLALSSAPLLLVLTFFHALALLIIPTLVLGTITFRLAAPLGEHLWVRTSFESRSQFQQGH